MTISSTRAQWRGAVILLLAALIWGTTFVAQSVGMDSIGALTFNTIRTYMGAGGLLLVLLVRRLLYRSHTPGVLFAPARNAADRPIDRRADRKTLLIGGVLIGVAHCIAGNLQQFAFNDTSAGKIALITALYMFFVPLIGLFIGKRTPAATWACVVLGFVGLYFLSVDPAQPLKINPGDFLALLCAFAFAVQILLIERFSPKADAIELSFLEFLVSGTLTAVLMFFFETPTASGIVAAMPSLLYAGVMSCGIAYTLQIVGQKYAEATVASLMMCMEAPFGVVASAILLHERLSERETVGCVIMLAAIILSQIPFKALTKRKLARSAR